MADAADSGAPERGQGDGGLSPIEDAHGVVRPVGWAPVLIGAGAAAAVAVLRGLRRRR